MPGPMPTRHEVEQLLLAARTRVIQAEDAGNLTAADKARAECDELTEKWASIPAPRVSA